MKRLKKYLFFITILVIALMFEEVNALPSLSINNGDYELTCTYRDGLVLTITKDEVYIQNNSPALDSTSSSGIKMYLKSDQKNVSKDDNGGLKYQHHAVTSGGKCPTKIYAYELPQKYEDNGEEGSNVSTLYYSTSSNVTKELGGTHETGNVWYCAWLCGSKTVNNAKRKDSLDTYLVSEEVNLTTTKSTTVCDYKIEETGSVFTVYMYDNITMVENNGYTTPLESKWTKCKAPTKEDIEAGKTKKVYINDPVGQNVSGGVGKRYNAKRYTITDKDGDCKNGNDGKKCVEYVYLGTRNGAPGDGTDNDLCTVLGNKTIKELQNIIDIMQILVPVLMIALTGFDIGKLVLSGNLDEELPKKKTIIIVRFCLTAFFFFLPLITGLIIDGLMDAGVVGVVEIDCVLTR